MQELSGKKVQNPMSYENKNHDISTLLTTFHTPSKGVDMSDCTLTHSLTHFNLDYTFILFCIPHW